MRLEKDVPLKLSGASSQPPDLLDFVNVCMALRSCLNQVSRCLIGTEIEYRVSNLRSSSAYLEATPPPYARIAESHLYDVAGTITQTVRDIQNGQEVDSRLDFAAIRAFSGFCAPLKKEGVSIEIGGHRIGPEFVSRMAELLAPSSPSHGSATGRLDTISVHKQMRFTLYTPMQGEDIECEFESGDLPKVITAIGRKVTVYGELQYAKTKVFPIRIAVSDFAVQPDDNELPTLLGARGILKDNPAKLREDWDADWE